MTKDIKIKEELWNLIVSGEKTTEFRELSKGLTTGTYRFVSVEYYSCPLFDIKKTKWDAEKGIEVYDHPHCKYWVETDKGTFCMECNKHFTSPKEVFGTATLTPTAINPTIFVKDDNEKEHRGTMNHSDYFFITRESYNFVREHYIVKHDFIAYNITDVKDLR